MLGSMTEKQTEVLNVLLAGGFCGTLQTAAAVEKFFDQTIMSQDPEDLVRVIDQFASHDSAWEEEVYSKGDGIILDCNIPNKTEDQADEIRSDLALEFERHYSKFYNNLSMVCHGQ